MLSLARISGQYQSAAAERDRGPHDCRRLRRPAAVEIHPLTGAALPGGTAPAIPRRTEQDLMAAENSDMRLVVAGAGGRMGRTLIHAIAATKGVKLAGAVEAAGSAVIGRDAGELAGLGSNGVKVVSDVAPLLRDADGLIEF